MSKAYQMPSPYLAPPHIEFYDFMIAGVTPMVEGYPFDETIWREHGMHGYIMNLTIEGQGLIYEGDKCYEVTAGDLLLFPPYVKHHYKRSSKCAKWYHYWVYFFPRGYWSSALQWPLLAHSKKSVHSASNESAGASNERAGACASATRTTSFKEQAAIGYYHVEGEDFKVFKELFLELINRAHLSFEHSKMLSSNFLEQMLWRRVELEHARRETKTATLDSSLPSIDDIEFMAIDHRVKIALVYIAENIATTHLTVKDIGAYVGLSASRISHLFESQLGMSPIKWRDNERFKLAKSLLSSTDLTIESIALKIGINDVPYFFKFFKRYAGQTPGEFRKEIKPSVGQ